MADPNAHHEMLEPVAKRVRDRELIVWMCTCGTKGKGSATMRAAQAGWMKHAGYSRPVSARPAGRRMPRW